MDADIISYESMLAARDSANWAYWGMVAVWISVPVSVLTFVLACIALNTWKKQEKLRVKKDFKASLFQLRTLLLYMPDEIDELKLQQGRKFLKNPAVEFQIGLLQQEFNERKDYAKEFIHIEEGMQKCFACWVDTENILLGTKVSKFWSNIITAYEKYVLGEGKKLDVIKEIDAMLEQPFVF